MQTLCSESGLRTAPNWSQIRKMTITSQFSDMTSTSNFFDVVLFFLSSLVTSPSFMSISSVVLKSSFVRDWPEIRKSETPSYLSPKSGDWGELRIPNVARMSLIECYWMLQNSRVTTFTVFELLRESQLGGGVKITTPPPRLGLIRKEVDHSVSLSYIFQLSPFNLKNVPFWWFYCFIAFILLLFYKKVGCTTHIPP